MAGIYYMGFLGFFLLFGEATELVERAMDGERGGMEQSHATKWV